MPNSKCGFRVSLMGYLFRNDWSNCLCHIHLLDLLDGGSWYSFLVGVWCRGFKAVVFARLRINCSMSMPFVTMLGVNCRRLMCVAVSMSMIR